MHPMTRSGSRLLRALASLELTMACLAVLMALVVICTVAQVELGTQLAVERTMRSLAVWWQVPGRAWKVPVLPGGVLVALVLLVNLGAMAWKRFQWRASAAGIWLIHAGLAVLVVAELVSGITRTEMLLALEEGEAKDYLESPRDMELAVSDGSGLHGGPAHGIPEWRLTPGENVTVPGTPLTLRVQGFLRNAAFSLRTETSSSASQRTRSSFKSLSSSTASNWPCLTTSPARAGA